MNDELTFEEREDQLIGAALKAEAFRRPLPPGMAERLAARVREAVSPRRAMPRWLKVAASLAAIATFAAFAAVVGLREAEPTTGDAGLANQGETQVEETSEEIFVEKLEGLKQQEEKSMNIKLIRPLASGAFAAAVSFSAPSVYGAVHSSVFDDVKVWYKGSAGNAVGTADSGNNQVGNAKNLPQLGDASSSMHGGTYHWWGWRMSYENQPVYCPYANVTLDSTPCMVIASPVSTNSMETVTINGVETTQPNVSYRCGDLHFTNWLAGRDSACENYTLVLRFRNESINPIPGNQNRAIQVGAVWTSTAGYAAGMDLRLTPQEALGEYYSPRIVVGNNQQEFKNIRIQDNRWVDCAIAVSGQNLVATFCWSDGDSNAIARVTYTYPTSGPQPAIAANCTTRIGGAEKASCTFTRGVEISSSNWTYGFRGAFHQIAFWDRTLSDDEIREAMAGGTGRPNLVQVGMEGNGIAEFAASSQTASVSNTGAWEYLNPALSSENTTATISFTCPTLWAGLPQWLRVCGASGSGRVSAAVNGTPVGECTVAANGVGRIFVPANVIVSGANTLVLTRTEGSPVLDAVTLGGSWRFGESIGSFATPPATIDQFVFHPAGANDKFRDRTLNASGTALTEFHFFVPEDMVGKYRGMFTTRVQNTGGSTFNFELFENGTSLGIYGLKGGNNYEIKVPTENIVTGWNTFAWKRLAGWANIDWHKFTLLPPKKGTIIIVK